MKNKVAAAATTLVLLWRSNWQIVAGSALIGLSWAARKVETLYPVVLVLGGLLLLLGRDVLDRVTKAKLSKDGLELEMTKKERAASAKAADSGIPPESLGARLDSNDQRPPSPSAQDPEVIGSLNYSAGSMAILAILDHAKSNTELQGCDLRLYLYDDDLEALAPIFHEGENATTWPLGKGATGVAYQSQQYVAAVGTAVWDATFGLTAEQREKYQHLKAVASSPIFSAAGRTIAVITASTTDEGSRLVSPEGERDLTVVALLISRVMIELLQWFDDD